MNSAGENDVPWQTQIILISDFEYRYRNPFTVLPSGPLPVLVTHGILANGSKLPLTPLLFGRGFGGFPVSFAIELEHSCVSSTTASFGPSVIRTVPSVPVRVLLTGNLTGFV